MPPRTQPSCWPGTVQTEGPRWPVRLTIRPVLAGLGGLALALVIGRRRPRRSRSH